MRKVNLLWSALVALGLSACSQNDLLDGISSDSSEISGNVMTEITSSSGNAASTRFDGSTGYWETGDAIGVYLIQSGSTSILNDVENIEFTLSDGSGTDTGTFTNETGITYPSDDTSIIFHCYYPYSDDVASYSTSTSDCIWSVDLSDQSEGYKDYEIMYGSTSTTGTTVGTSGVSVTFEHKVAKATIYVTPEENVTVSSATITGLVNSASFAPIGGTLTDGDSGNITACLKDENGTQDTDGNTYYTYEAIILPTTDISGLGLKFEASNGYTYAWTYDGTTSQIQAGYEYVFYIGLGTEPSTEGGTDDTNTSTETLTKITGTAPGEYSGSVTLTDEDGDEASIYYKAYDYDEDTEVVSVSSDDTSLATLLETAAESGETSVALCFSSSATYSASYSAIDIPSGITTLILFCNDSDAAEISFSDAIINTNQTLDYLYVYNMNITGGGISTSWIYRDIINKAVEFESSTFQQMDNVLQLEYNSAETMEGFTFTDCVFLDCSTIVGNLGNTTTVTNGITFTNCTVGLTETGKDDTNNVVSTSSPTTCDVTLTNCTLHTQDGAAFYSGSNAKYMKFTNSIVVDGCTTDNASRTYGYFYYIDSESSGNFSLNINSRSNGIMNTSDNNNNNGVGFTSVSSWEDLFTSTIYTGEYNLSSSFVSSNGTCGDPRWYSE